MQASERFLLNGKIALVTGAFGKLGALWCQTLLEAGGRVVAMDRPGTEPSDVLKSLQQTFGSEQVFWVYGDVTDTASLKSARTQVEQTFGVVEILVNNAGIDQPPDPNASGSLYDIPFERFTRILEVNIAGAFACMQVFGEAMVQAGKGSIINIGSLYASVSPDPKFYDHIGTPDQPFFKPPAYGASKAGLVNLTQYFSTHWGASGVRVNALSPGGVEGGQDPQFKAKFCNRVPLARMAQLEDLAGPLLFLASDASCYVTGIELKVDGGFTAW